MTSKENKLYFKNTEHDPTKTVIENSRNMALDKEIQDLTKQLMEKVSKYYYSYNYTWLGRPIIQFPQDIMAMQEIVWKVKPDLIIETGVAHGGSLIFYSSLLELIGGDGMVIGIDISVRDHNKKEIINHKMSKRITLIEGSSTSDEVVERVRNLAKKKKNILVCLDSNHTHEHVLKELNLYSSFVTKDSYLIVFDTFVEDMPEDFVKNRPWKKGDNPKTALFEFLKTNDRFIIDKDTENKLLFTVATDGYLKCIK